MKQLLLLGLALDRACRLALAQQHERAVDEVERLLGFLVVALRLLLERVDALFQALEISEHQFGLDRLDVGDGIDLALDVGDVGILEAAHDVHDGVDLADGGEELVAEAFALGRALHQAGNVDEGDARRDDLLGLGQAAQLLQPLIGHGDLSDIWLDRAKRIVRRLRRSGLRQCVEERGLADVRQADDAAFETHGSIFRQFVQSASLPSPKPFASSPRWPLFWKLESLPSARRPALSAMRSHSASPHGRSLLAKSERTCVGAISLIGGLRAPMRTRL